MKEKIVPFCDKVIEIGAIVAAIVIAAKAIKEALSLTGDVKSSK